MISLPRTTEPLARVVTAFNDAMALIESKLRRVPDSVYVDTQASPVADTAFPVYHTLSRVPKFFQYQAEQALNCYALPADRDEWTPTSIVIRCNVNNAQLRIRIEA